MPALRAPQVTYYKAITTIQFADNKHFVAPLRGADLGWLFDPPGCAALRALTRGNALFDPPGRSPLITKQLEIKKTFLSAIMNKLTETLKHQH